MIVIIVYTVILKFAKTSTFYHNYNLVPRVSWNEVVTTTLIVGKKSKFSLVRLQFSIN